ncbi:MAG: rhodanese-like domain-containing protein [Oscillospiraceae bacterium]|nr:rhodanese-like domain-containing protein [Oscillospiraceae bacterium]
MPILLVAAFFMLAGCTDITSPDMPSGGVPVPTPGYSHTDRHEWWLESATAFEQWSSTEGALIIDVRSEESFLDRHVLGAINVPIDELSAFAEENIHAKDTLIITYCFCGGMGGPALTARNILAGLGYTNVFYADPQEDKWMFGGSDMADKNGALAVIITGDEAKELVETNDTVILLDVRNPDEFEEIHIENSILIPVAELSERLEDLPEDKDVKIIVYCRGGVRSARAVEILVAGGYTNVYDMQMVSKWFE